MSFILFSCSTVCVYISISVMKFVVAYEVDCSGSSSIVKSFITLSIPIVVINFAHNFALLHPITTLGCCWRCINIATSILIPCSLRVNLLFLKKTAAGRLAFPPVHIKHHTMDMKAMKLAFVINRAIVPYKNTWA